MYNLKLQNLDNGNQINFSPHFNWVITDVAGIDELGISLSESQGINQVGTSIQGNSIPSRLITVYGEIIGGATQKKEQLVRTLPPLANLRLTFDNKLYIDGNPEITPKYERYPNNVSFQFSIRCPYPYWRYAEQEATMLAGMGGMFSFPINYSIGNTATVGLHAFGRRVDEAYRNVYNSGNVPCPFRVKFRAISALSNPKILDMETRKYIRMKKDMAVGETINIDMIGQTLKITSEINGVVENAFRYFDTNSSVPFPLAVGDNLIRYEADDNREGLNCTIYPAFAMSSPYGDDKTYI